VLKGHFNILLKNLTLEFKVISTAGLVLANVLLGNFSNLPILILIIVLFLIQNLLVTSTLTICTDPYPRAVSPKPAEPERDMEESQVHSDPVSNGLETTAGDGDEEMVEAEADEDAPSADADVHDAQVVDTEIDAQSADTEVHNAQVADTEVHDPQNADTEVHDIQNVDTEMQEEKASEAPESSPDQSSDSNSLREPCTTIKQNPPTPEQP